MTDKDLKPNSSVERRTTKRFPIEQEAYYKILDHRAAAPESGQRLRTGKRGELSVDWPAQLEGPPLKFVALGRVVRAEDTRAAMHIEQHEFRTRRNKELPPVETEKPPRARVQF
jgi:hypothetical protein